ncbi:unnamed protein product [Blepharisma stoltei]|uniref:Uncharacterized protein n=1 Tax=Blepharisma stoltei TaxID=1481888 RepID=A0AAU9K551_9CILI|nr:unnamed protein product [Blepharisma stoltei]
MDERKFLSGTLSIPHPRSSFRSITTAVNNHLEEEAAKKSFNSLPKLPDGQRLGIYSLFAVYANSSDINVNIPITLIRVDNAGSLYLLKTDENGTIVSRACSDNDFFYPNGNMKKAKSEIYFYKTLYRESHVLNSRESAELFWKQSKDWPAMIQCCVQCKSKPTSVTRAVWRAGVKTRYCTIINRQQVSDSKAKKSSPNLYQKKKSLSILGDFKYTNMILKTSRSVNNPFKVNLTGRASVNEKPKFERTMTMKNKDNRNADTKEHHHGLIVNTRAAESILVVDDPIKAGGLDPIVAEIIDFLNINIYKNQELKGIVLDFVHDKDNRWVLLDCKEISTHNRSPSITSTKKFQSISQTSRSRLGSEPETVSTSSRKSSESSPLKYRSSQLTINASEEKQACPFVIRSPRPPPSPVSNSAQGLVDRWNRVNQKLELILNLKPSNEIKNANIEEQSIKAYSTRYILKNSVAETGEQSTESERSAPSPPHMSHPTSNALWTDENNDHINRCFTDAIGRIEEMNMNTELLKVKSQNLVLKYGGDTFWNSFIQSLYKKVMFESTLKRYFTRSNIDMIMNGMNKVFNGCATLQFRRKIKAAHQNMGIPERDFSIYSALFEDTLNEFNIEERDKSMIMSQIKSMKCLICQTPNQ